MNDGLRHLSMEASKNGVKLIDSSKVMVIPQHSFIDQLITNMRKYIAAPHGTTWAEHIVISHNSRNLSNLYGIK